MKNIILASGSPRRIEIMKDHGLDPEIRPADVNENLPFYMTPEASVMYLAFKKAVHTATLHYKPDSIYISADTIVEYKGQIIGKPHDSGNAFHTLHELRNDTHHVITGVCILETGSAQSSSPLQSFKRKECFYETTSVFFKDYSDDELLAYVNTAEPYDKAGGYAIQGTFGKYIDHIEGDYDNVVGFPWERIAALLKL